MGVPLVCVHGLAGSSRWWDAVAPGLAAGRPLELLDLPRRLAPADATAWVSERIAALDRPVDMIGHSLGALVALRVAARRPTVVRRLVLVAPTGLRPVRTPAHLAPALVASLTRARPRFLARLVTDATRAGPANILRGGFHAASADARAELAARTGPTLLVLGARDPLVPLEGAIRAVEGLPHVRVAVLSGAGHVPMVETPRDLVAAVTRFLEEPLDEVRDHAGV